MLTFIDKIIDGTAASDQLDDYINEAIGTGCKLSDVPEALGMSAHEYSAVLNGRVTAQEIANERIKEERAENEHDYTHQLAHAIMDAHLAEHRFRIMQNACKGQPASTLDMLILCDWVSELERYAIIKRDIAAKLAQSELLASACKEIIAANEQ